MSIEKVHILACGHCGKATLLRITAKEGGDGVGIVPEANFGPGKEPAPKQSETLVKDQYRERYWLGLATPLLAVAGGYGVYALPTRAPTFTDLLAMLASLAMIIGTVFCFATGATKWDR